MAAEQGFRVQAPSTSQSRMKCELPLMPAFFRIPCILLDPIQALSDSFLSVCTLCAAASCRRDCGTADRIAAASPSPQPIYGRKTSTPPDSLSWPAVSSHCSTMGTISADYPHAVSIHDRNAGRSAPAVPLLSRRPAFQTIPESIPFVIPPAVCLLDTETAGRHFIFSSGFIRRIFRRSGPSIFQT